MRRLSASSGSSPRTSLRKLCALAPYERLDGVTERVDGTVRETLARWGTGGLRRPPSGGPFGDVIQSGRAEKAERALASHPTLKPQAFLRQVVHAILPLGEGMVLDPFAGSGSTLAAAEAIGYASIGVEVSGTYVRSAKRAIPKLAALEVPDWPARTVEPSDAAVLAPRLQPAGAWRA